MSWNDLTIIEAVFGIAALVFLGWVTWASRRSRRFRAGFFVERDDKDE